jgi:hypothetical protein
VGGVTGALVGMGYEGRLQKGGILLSVHCDTSEEIKRAKEVMERTGREDVASMIPRLRSRDRATVYAFFAWRYAFSPAAIVPCT